MTDLATRWEFAGDVLAFLALYGWMVVRACGVTLVEVE